MQLLIMSLALIEELWRRETDARITKDVRLLVTCVFSHMKPLITAPNR